MHKPNTPLDDVVPLRNDKNYKNGSDSGGSTRRIPCGLPYWWKSCDEPLNDGSSLVEKEREDPCKSFLAPLLAQENVTSLHLDFPD